MELTLGQQLGRYRIEDKIGQGGMGSVYRATDRTPDLAMPGLTVAELRVRLDVLNKVLTELVGRTVRADSEEAGLLRIALDHARAIDVTLGSSAES
jgi:hypothetical protein